MRVLLISATVLGAVGVVMFVGTERVEASGLTWADLRAEVVALVPPGPTQDDLAARAEAIEFV